MPSILRPYGEADPMKPNLPLAYQVWETHRASNRQRKSPQWASIRQRHNYYRQYCYFWADKFGEGLTIAVMFQAAYSPHLADHLAHVRNPFLDALDHQEHVRAHQAVFYAPVIFPEPDKGAPDDET